MTQDFAKIKPEPLLERKTVATPPAWSLMFTGVIVGMALGVFGSFLFYLSGNVPPLNINQPTSNNAAPADKSPTLATPEEPAEDELRLEFYTELPAYEVAVDVNPVELTAQQAGIAEGTSELEEVSVTGSPKEIEEMHEKSWRIKIEQLRKNKENRDKKQKEIGKNKMFSHKTNINSYFVNYSN